MKHEADQYEWKSMECHFSFLPPYITMLQYLDTGNLYAELVTRVYNSAYDGHLNKG